MRFRKYAPPLSLKLNLRYYWAMQSNSFPVSDSGKRLLTERFEVTCNPAAPNASLDNERQRMCRHVGNP
jgi:hypothetical protein